MPLLEAASTPTVVSRPTRRRTKCRRAHALRPTAIRYDRPLQPPGCERLVVERSLHLWSLYHDRHEIWWVADVEPDADGRRWVSWRQRGEINVAAPPFVILAAPGDLQTWIRLSGPATLRGLALSHDWMNGAAVAAARPPLRHVLGSSEAAVTDLARLHAAWDAGTSVPVSDVRTTVARLFEAGEDEHDWLADAPLHPAVVRTRAYLEERAFERVSLEDLAASTRLSPFYLHRRFTTEVGLTPRAYHLRVRLAAARTLLSEGVPIGHVEVGFADQSHLTRHFQRVLGITPGRYARALQRPAPHDKIVQDGAARRP